MLSSSQLSLHNTQAVPVVSPMGDAPVQTSRPFAFIAVLWTSD